jgi:ribonucleoside-diphosphate reductase alpha subunit
MFVVKRNGNKEQVKFDKITSRLQKLIENECVDPILITQKLSNRIYPGITTTELDILASQICMDMIMENPDFGKLGAKIAISNHQKNTDVSFIKVIEKLKNNKDINGNDSPLINDEVYEIANKYYVEIDNIIDMERDYLLDFFGFKTLEKSYLLKCGADKKTKKIVERPQHLFMRVAIGIHGDDIKSVKKLYDNLSLKMYTHATPTLFNAGMPFQQLSSCYLLGTEDSIEGIFETITDCAKISKWSGGIGVHISNIRANGSYIRKTAGYSDGILPMLKVYNDTARYINQGGGKRNGSFAMYLEPYHADIFDFLDAKKNIGSDEIRARDLFYALWVPDLFMETIEKDGDWYLMCPNICPGLPDVYGEEFNTLYNKYVEEGKYVKKIKARDLWKAVIGAQVELGIPYIGYKDHVNRKNNQKNIGTIKSSNLCIEINEVSNSTETAVCNLASVCLPSIIKKPDSLLQYKNTEWLSLLSNEEKEVIKIIFSGELFLYSNEDCMYCKLLKTLLKETKLLYTEIEGDTAEKYRIISEPSLSVVKPFETVPQLFTKYEGKIYHIGGYDDTWKLLKPRISYKTLYNLSYELIGNLNKVIDKNFYPTEKTKLSNMRHRPTGLGVQGLADVFMCLKIPFDSEEARQINKDIFETMYFGAVSASCDIASKEGPYSTFEGSPMSKGEFQFNMWGLKEEELSGKWNWKELRERVIKNGVRNSLLIALMPTASTSQIMGSVVECFEPLSSNLYARRTLAGEFTVINPYLIEDLVSLDIWNEETQNRLQYDRGSVQNIKGLPKFLKDVYRTAYEIPQKSIITMSAERGPFVCQSQSLNLFFDKPDFKKLTASHFAGWKMGLKTGSYYIRSKPAITSQRFGMDITKEKAMKEEDEKECLSCGA